MRSKLTKKLSLAILSLTLIVQQFNLLGICLAHATFGALSATTTATAATATPPVTFALS